MMKAYYLRLGHTFTWGTQTFTLLRTTARKGASLSPGRPSLRGVPAVIGLSSVLLGLLGCQRTAEPKAEPVSVSSSVAPATSAVPERATAERPVVSAPALPPPNGAADLAIEWTDPSEWQRVTPKSRMRLAQYQVNPVAGDTEPGEVTLFHFGPNMGGSVEDNIQRWTKQFSEVSEKAIKRTTRSNGGLTHYLVQIDSGQFQSSPMMGGPAEPKANYGLLGAVTEAPSGKYFFKLTGPSKTVAANRAAFDKLIDSMKSK